MRLAIIDNRVSILNPAAKWLPDLQRWFGVRRHPRGKDIWFLPTPKKHLLALVAWLRDEIEVNPLVQSYIGHTWSYDQVMVRMRPHLKTYRGGYQAKILAHAIANRAHGVMVDVGGGKTTMALEFARLVGPTLIIVEPVIYEDAYAGSTGDIKRWYSDLKIHAAMGGAGDTSRKAALREPADVYIVSPYVLHSAIGEILELPLAGAVVDESSRFKNPLAQKTRELLALAERVDCKMNLSADMAASHAGELHSQISFLAPNRLGEYAEFCEKFGGTKTKWGYKFDDEKASTAVLNKVSDLITVLPKEKFWADAPPLVSQSIRVELSREQRVLYDRALNHARLSFEKDGKRIDTGIEKATARLMKLREIASGFLYYGLGRDAVRIANAQKPKALLHLLRHKNYCAIRVGKKGRWQGHQTIVWLHFKEEFAIVGEVLRRAGIPYCEIGGHGESKGSNDARIDFKAGRFPVLLAQPKSCSHGIRLECATRAIFYTPDWSAEDRHQAIGRMHRPPQRYECRCYTLVAANTIDEEILLAQQGKADWRTLVATVLGQQSAKRVLGA